MRALLAVALTALLSPVGSPVDRPPAVALILVPDLTWESAPDALDGFAKANLSVRTARLRGRPEDGFATVGAGLRTTAGTLEHRGALGDALKRASRTWELRGNDRRARAAAVDGRGRVPPPPAAGGSDAVIVGTGRAALPAALAAHRDARCVIVASVSTPGPGRQLGALAASRGCGFGTEGLRSRATHRAHLANLTDVPATFLATVGVRQPQSFTGTVVVGTGGGSRSSLVDAADRAATADRTRTAFVLTFAALHLIGALLIVRRIVPTGRVAVALLAIVPCSFLAMLVPWWRWGYAGGVATVGALTAILAVVVGRYSGADAGRGVVALAGLGAAVIGIDAMAGGYLEVDAFFGNSTIGGGRFYGIGNIAFGFFAAALVVVAGVALDRGRLGARWIAAMLAVGVVVDGGPWFGADSGGVLATVPAFGALLLSHRHGRVVLRRIIPLMVGGLATLAAFAALDLSRPPGRRTHLGRALAEGDFDEIILSKGGRALEAFTAPIGLVLVIAVVVLVLVRPALEGRPALRAMAGSLVLLAVLGSALNDSGVQVAAAVAAVSWPALVAVAPWRSDLRLVDSDSRLVVSSP